ncbi:unnamed protein product [Bursaphelenchus okinawaensis]|uniref:Uncharacterized protein n=1 Tax=Bursaphelenchus okinawaensis TaxID=465554 RepID=A0A811LCR1_9BILA|nr:unnamed protein product [Bursaphelenchus okinawaensis]CAG9120706.1 unnamed protein product [Bursaphelenchus okinawaensis]
MDRLIPKLMLLFLLVVVCSAITSPEPTTLRHNAPNPRFFRSVTPITMLDHKTTNVLQRPLTVTHPLPL